MNPVRQRRGRVLEHLAQLHEMLAVSDPVEKQVAHDTLRLCHCQLAKDYREELHAHVARADDSLAALLRRAAEHPDSIAFQLREMASDEAHASTVRATGVRKDSLTIRLQSERKAEEVVVTRVLMAWDLSPLESVGVIVTDVGQWQLLGAALKLAEPQAGGRLVVEFEGDREVVGAR